jgi:predicted nucleic acid-binding protein
MTLFVDTSVWSLALRRDAPRKGLQIGTIDALLAQLCLRHGLLMLTTDQDFHLASAHIGLRVWNTRPGRH